MKVVKIDELDLSNTFFHFTRAAHLQDININGLNSNFTKRENTVGRDLDNPCIYFSKGSNGLLKTVDVWIRWEYNKMADAMRQPRGDECIKQDVLQRTYKKLFEDFKNRRYLKLDLVEGKDPETSDFSSEGVDYKKESALKKDKIPSTFRWLYGEYTNFDSPVMEDWNMNTHIGIKRIDPSKITLLADSLGRTDALSIIYEIYYRYKSPDLELKSLDGFMKYVKEQLKAMELEEER